MALYEAMILLENNFARENWEKAEEILTTAVTKNGGKVENLVKWDERKLAYEIKKQKRGTYAVMHFSTPTDSVKKIENEFVHVEAILRIMILRDTDGLEVPEPSEPQNVIASY
ncbi:MAG: 30S ribosomal protein S6 [Planctomycetota bacterium]|nr:MAG: 30S ribosomal protein S6 [Planctomycetota bacterium]